MSPVLLSGVLTVSYGFFGGSYLYATSYVCRLRMLTADSVEITTHTFLGGTQTAKLKLADIECKDSKLIMDEYQRFKRKDATLGNYFIDHIRGDFVNSKGLAAFIRTIGTSRRS